MTVQIISLRFFFLKEYIYIYCLYLYFILFLVIALTTLPELHDLGTEEMRPVSYSLDCWRGTQLHPLLPSPFSSRNGARYSSCDLTTRGGTFWLYLYQGTGHAQEGCLMLLLSSMGHPASALLNSPL